MPAISPAFEDRRDADPASGSAVPGGKADFAAIALLAATSPPPQAVALARPLSRSALIGRALGVMRRQAFQPVLTAMRRNALYRVTLLGRVPKKIALFPADVRPGRLEDADGYFRGRFRFAGATVQIRSGSIFDSAPPSEAFARALNGFEWLRHLEAAGGEAARDFALKATKSWLKRNARYRLPGWAPEVTAERLINIFAHGEFFLNGAEPEWRRKFFRSLRDQTRMLKRTLNEAQEGIPRLTAAASLMLAGLCFDDRALACAGWKRLSIEMARQILADGGHASRSPETLLEAFRILSLVASTAAAAHGDAPEALKATLARMAGAVRFFRLGDGALTSFHGGMEGNTETIAALFEGKGGMTPAASELTTSGYRRIGAARSVLVADVGTAPGFAFADKAHASCLAFELSIGGQRLIVNCGAASDMDAGWERSLRSTAAHATLNLGEQSQAAFLKGRFAALLGEKLVGGPSEVAAVATEGERGRFIEASHDAYAARFGLVHRRRLTLSPRGLSLTGADRLDPVPGKRSRANVPFAIRFHIHPDIRISLAQDGRSVILKLPNRDGWRFRWSGAELAIEASVYLGSRPMRRAEQLVLTGQAGAEPTEVGWLFEQVDGS